MVRRADRKIDEFVDAGRFEFIGDFAGLFSLYVIADLLGVPEADHEWFREELQGSHKRGGSRQYRVGIAQPQPLVFLYDPFTAYVEDCRRKPRDDALTILVTATFPDGSLPEVMDVVRIAANLFSAGQETTVRLLGTAFQLLGERADFQTTVQTSPAAITKVIEEMPPHGEPSQRGLSPRAALDHCRRCRDLRRVNGHGRQRCDRTRSSPLWRPQCLSAGSDQMPGSTSPSGAARLPMGTVGSDRDSNHPRTSARPHD